MIKVKNILFPTDFSRCASQAMDHALYLAKKYKAKLHMLHAIVLHEDDPHTLSLHLPDVEEYHNLLREQVHSRMHASLKEKEENDPEITLEQIRGFSKDGVILDYAKEKEIDLIVMGTHGRRGLGHLVLGSVAEKIVRLAHCPVLTIRESKKPKGVDQRANILVPIDFSNPSRMALAHAKEISAIYGSRLNLFHVIETTVHPYFYGTGKTTITELRPDIMSRCDEAMKRIFQETAGPEVEVTFRTKTGHAVQEILAYLENEKVDLLVISTHGLTGIKHFLIGSIAEKVIRRAPCPVLTVKPFGKSLIQE